MKRTDKTLGDEGAHQQKKQKLGIEEDTPQRISTIRMNKQGNIVSSSTQLKISNVVRSPKITNTLASASPVFSQGKKITKLFPKTGISIKTPDQLNQALPKVSPAKKSPGNGKQVVFVKKVPPKFLLPPNMMMKKVALKSKQPLQNASSPGDATSSNADKIFSQKDSVPGLRLPSSMQANRISLQASPAALSKLTAQMKNAGIESPSKEINISMKETTEYIKALESENQQFKNIISKISGEMEEIKQKFSGWERIMKGLTTPAIGVFNNPNVQKIPTLRLAPKKSFKLPRFPISNYEAFCVFEKEMTFQKYYDLVFASVSKVLPPVVEKRSLIGYLRRIITDDLLSEFVWDASQVEGCQTKAELSKFYNFQSLLFSLVNKYKALNFPMGIKWNELEVFLKHQMRVSRERAQKRLQQLEPMVMIEEIEPDISEFKDYKNLKEIPEYEEFEQTQPEKIEAISKRGRRRVIVNYMEDMPKNPIVRKKKQNITMRPSLPNTLPVAPNSLISLNLSTPTISIDLDEEPINDVGIKEEQNKPEVIIQV